MNNIILICLLLIRIDFVKAEINSVTPFQVKLGSAPNKYPDMNVANELLRYNRCYAHLVRNVVPKSDSKIDLIKTKAINGTEACMTLIEEAKLNSNGQINKDNQGNYQTIAQSVLKTLNDFHRSWFPTYDYRSTNPCGEFLWRNNYAIYNNGEMALHLTNALFSKNTPYSSIVTNPESFEPIRDDRSSGDKTINGVLTNNEVIAFLPNGTETRFRPHYLSTGNLVGLKTITPDSLPNLTNYRSSVGGGVLGTNPYLMLNSGRDNAENINGGLVQHRRWSKAVFSDLFCRDIPVVRLADAVAKVNRNSAIPFRRGISCMQCHSSIDPLAQIMRNRTNQYTYSCNVTSMGYLSNQSVEKTQESTAQVEGDKDFYKRPPLGNFYFRTYDGKLLNQDEVGAEEMGKFMATVDDLYICAAKRYFQFFTGIDVPLFDSEDFSAPKLPPSLANYRKMVIELGLDLKKSQNLEILISNIISSSTYINPSPGAN